MEHTYHDNHNENDSHNSNHKEHDHHVHMIEDFKKRFWVSLVITLPIIVLAPMLIY